MDVGPTDGIDCVAMRLITMDSFSYDS